MLYLKKEQAWSLFKSQSFYRGDKGKSNTSHLVSLGAQPNGCIRRRRKFRKDVLILIPHLMGHEMPQFQAYLPSVKWNAAFCQLACFMSFLLVCTIYKIQNFRSPSPPPWWRHIRENVPLFPPSSSPLESEFSSPSRNRNWGNFKYVYSEGTTFTWKHVGNMKICVEKMKKYVTLGFRRAKHWSYIPFFLYKGPGTWKNSELSSYRLWNFEERSIEQSEVRVVVCTFPLT